MRYLLSLFLGFLLMFSAFVQADIMLAEMVDPCRTVFAPKAPSLHQRARKIVELAKAENWDQFRESVKELGVNNPIDNNPLDHKDSSFLFVKEVIENPKAVQILIEEGVSINRLDEKNRNALFYALEYSPVEVFDILIKNGININAKSAEKRYNTIYEVALDKLIFIRAEFENKEERELEKNRLYAIMKHLKDNGAEIKKSPEEILEEAGMDPLKVAELSALSKIPPGGEPTGFLGGGPPDGLDRARIYNATRKSEKRSERKRALSDMWNSIKNYFFKKSPESSL